MGVNSLPKTVIRQRRGCDLNLGPIAPESSTLTTRLPSHPASQVDATSRNSFARGRRAGGNVSSAGWQVTLCDLIWHVSSRSGEACSELTAVDCVHIVHLLRSQTSLPKRKQSG